MNWMQQLAETYDNCRSQIGYGAPGRRPLLPICHVTAQAQIEIVISHRGNFRRAVLIADKTCSTTIVPCTEGSASRAGSKPENHPLCDKLQYLAGDYTEFGGEVTSGFSKDPEEPFRNFVSTLTRWCDSEFSHPKAQAVLKYVQKKMVMKDLIEHQILLVGPNGKLRAKDNVLDKNAKNIFSLIARQDGAFVRWVIEDFPDSESRTWYDESLWESWIRHYLSGKKETGLCLVSGELQVLSGNHPKYVRWEGDGAKLISSNDTSGFTFRGRFATDGQACGLGLEASHKAHYALSWLIDRQGYSKDGLVIVAWAKSGASIPQPTDGSNSLFFGDAPAEEARHAYTAQELALKLKKRIAGYGAKLDATDQIVIIALDSATTGRLALTYYRDLTGSDFLKRIDDWHETCAWLHRYEPVEVTDQESGKTLRKYPCFVGAPAPRDIAEASYGSVDDKLRKTTVQRILPCIIDGQPVPRDLVEFAVRRASNRASMDDWRWNKTLSIACALFRKSNTKEEYSMALDPARNSRDYLYGRLLALADSLEEWALSEANEHRQTNAGRLMQRFAEHPYSTWRTIELALTPYKARLGGKARKRLQMIDEVAAACAPDDFINDKPLSGEFLLGYHSQREALRSTRAQEENSGQEEPQPAVTDYQ